MKFKKLQQFDDELDERFTNTRTKVDHYQRHVLHNGEYSNKLTAEEYEQLADALAKATVDNKNIFGYETTAPDGDTRTRYAKYNKETEDFVVYGYNKNEPQIISLHKKTWRQYTIDKSVKYMGEIPAGK